MPNTPLSQLEYEWFATRSSIVSTVLVGVHKAAYFSRGSLASAGLKPLTQLEQEWLSLITGLTITQGQQALWQSAVAAYSSGATGTNNIFENKWLFYSLATIDNLA